MFGYIRKHDIYRVVFDLFKPKVYESLFASGMTYQKGLYGYINEEFTQGNLEPLDKSFHITFFVDDNHAGKFVSRRLHTGVFIYVMNTSIIWFWNEQNTVESSTFGSEFVAQCIKRDLIVSLHYKLRMFCLPLDGTSNVMCDNQGVVNKKSLPQYTVKK